MPPSRQRKPAKSQRSAGKPTAKPTSANARRSTRNDVPPPAEVVTAAPQALVARVPRRQPPLDTPAGARAAQNLLDALGGPKAVIPRLRASGNAKAVRLADLMSDTAFRSETFDFKMNEVSMNVREFTELLTDVNNATAVARMTMAADKVAE